VTTGSEPGDGPDPQPLSRRAAVVQQVKRLIAAIRNNDETKVESAVLALSQRSRWLAPLALVVGAFAMLFQGLKLLVTNWRLTLVEILPAMWIWAAMLDLKLHVFRGKEFHIIRGPLLIPILLVIASITAASFFLNAVFAFAIAKPGAPQIRPAFAQAREHLRPILSWGFTIGVALWFGAIIVQRWGKGWYALTLSIVVAVMMFAYVAVPSRLVGIKSARSRRDKLTATAVGGAIGGVVCSPPYALGRVAILLLGSHTFRVLAVIMLAVAVVLQTGATTATKAIKFSAKLVVSHKPSATDGAATTEPAPGVAEEAAAEVAPVADAARADTGPSPSV
jgi:hypothetical protein